MTYNDPQFWRGVNQKSGVEVSEETKQPNKKYGGEYENL